MTPAPASSSRACRKGSPRTSSTGLKAREGGLLPTGKGAVVGAKVAQRSGLALGSVLRLSPRLELRVEGVLEETGGLADNLIFVPLRAVQEAVGTENVTAVLVALSPGQKAEEVARALERAVPGVKAQTTGEVMRFAERALRISDWCVSASAWWPWWWGGFWWPTP